MSITLTSAVDTDDDTITIAAGTTAWDATASATVAAAGDWKFTQNSGDDGILQWYDQELSEIVTMTILGLDGGAVAISTDLIFTA